MRVFVEQHLGRPGTRAELNAAHRAAHRLADQGLCCLVTIPARPGESSSGLGIAHRVDPDVLERSPELLLAGRAMSNTLTAVKRQALDASRLTTVGLTPFEAAACLDDIDLVITNLQGLRDRLSGIAQHPRPQRGTASSSTAPVHGAAQTTTAPRRR